MRPRRFLLATLVAAAIHAVSFALVRDCSTRAPAERPTAERLDVRIVSAQPAAAPLPMRPPPTLAPPPPVAARPAPPPPVSTPRAPEARPVEADPPSPERPPQVAAVAPTAEAPPEPASADPASGRTTWTASVA